MRLIDANKVFKDKVISLQIGDVEGAIAKLREFIDNAPTVDAVHVVRCKDCKFNYSNQIPSENTCQLCVELPISDEFYCAYGERGEDETD